MTPEELKEFVELCMNDAIQTQWVGPWRKGDMAWNEGIRIVDDPDDFEYGDWLWLPPVYDYQNPERSLWGMVDWSRVEAEDFIISPSGMIVQHYGQGFHDIRCLPIALAKAIIWQHGNSLSHK